jgi:hypothetical protein
MANLVRKMEQRIPEGVDRGGIMGTAIWEEGLRYSPTLRFFEPANKSLMQGIRKWMDEEFERPET